MTEGGAEQRQQLSERLRELAEKVDAAREEFSGVADAARALQEELGAVAGQFRDEDEQEDAPS